MDEFEALPAQLEKMSTDTALLEAFKAPLLLIMMGTISLLERLLQHLGCRMLRNFVGNLSAAILCKNSGELEKVKGHQA